MAVMLTRRGLIQLPALAYAATVTLFCLKRERPLWALTLVDGIATFAATFALVWWGGPTVAPIGSLLTVALLTLPAALGLIAMEGTVRIGPILRSVAIWGVLCAGVGVTAFYFAAYEAVLAIWGLPSHEPLPADTILNVNVPDLPWEELRGFVATRLGHRHKAEPVIKAKDPRGRPIYWVGPPGGEQDAGGNHCAGATATAT